jgi:phosphodiesterase/alkaline phosphatase D-like protein
LQPGTLYHYRLSAESENIGKTEQKATVGQEEGSFTTAPASKIIVTKGSAGSITSTSAVVSGTVDPDGQPASYTFKLGLYKGAQTQYGTVYSGSITAATTPVAVSLALTGLQPGTEYAYVITAQSGDDAAESEPVAFRTEGLPVVLPLPVEFPLLTVPQTVFPVESVPVKHNKCRRGYTRDKHGKCVKAKKKVRRGAKVRHGARKRK